MPKIPRNMYPKNIEKKLIKCKISCPAPFTRIRSPQAEGRMTKKFHHQSVLKGGEIFFKLLGKPQFLWITAGGRKLAEIPKTLANHLTFASFLQNILFGP